jgi:hypothetical protein
MAALSKTGNAVNRPNGAFFIPERPAFFKTFLHHGREDADESSGGRVSPLSAV